MERERARARARERESGRGQWQGGSKSSGREGAREDGGVRK